MFFGGFGTWAVLVPLSGAAIAPAVVAPEGFRKTIQHLEGGIVSEIRVQEGSQVEAGDVIVVLDATRARADYRWCPGATGLHARPAAVGFRRAGAATPTFADDLVAEASSDPDVRA